MSLEEEERLDSGMTAAVVIPRLHLTVHQPTEEERAKMEELRKMVQGTTYLESEAHREWVTDRVLIRFLIARNFDADKARDMLLTALAWRDLRKPHTLTAMSEELEFESRTGKIYFAGHDRWQRPVIIFNNSVNNSADPDAQMRYLAFNIEHALKEVGSSKICKFAVFMHMYNFSLLNTPPFKVTRETIQMLTTCYPETMGHCIIYQPPRIFSAFFESVKRFIDPRTASKIMMISGDCSPGSANDKTMSELLGPDWKVLTGAEQPVLVDKCSPGFDHREYWPRMQERERALSERSQRPHQGIVAHQPARPSFSDVLSLPPGGNIFKGLIKTGNRRTPSGPSNGDTAGWQCRPSSKSAPPPPTRLSARHHQGSMIATSVHLAGANSPSAVPKVLSLVLLSAATAMAWCGAVCRQADPSAPTVSPSWFCSAQSRFIMTFDPSSREPGEDLLVILLAITTFFILGAYPNRYLLNHLPLKKFTPGGKNLFPLKKAPTPTYVLTANSLSELATSSNHVAT